MDLGQRPLAIAAIWAGVALVAMLALLQGDWRNYLVPLALWACAVFLVTLRWQTAPWLRGRRSTVAKRVIRATSLSCLGLLGVCTLAAVGVAKLSGCPIIGDPGGTIDFRNDDSVTLIVYPEGVEVPRTRMMLSPGEERSFGYLVSCGSFRHDEAIFRVIGAEYAGAWVYCREVTRGEVDQSPALGIVRGDLRCTPSVLPAGSP